MRNILLFAILASILFVSCKSDAPDYPDGSIEQKIANKYLDVNKGYTINSITLKDSVNTSNIKDSLSLYTKRMEASIEQINDSSIVSVLVQDLNSVRYKIDDLNRSEDDNYHVYQIATTDNDDKSHKTVFYAIVRGDSINIATEEPENSFVKDFKRYQSGIKEVVSKLESLAKREHSELIQMKNAELQRQEEARIAAEKAEKERLAEIERNRIPEWDEVADIIKKKTGGRVIGIWQSGNFGYVIYNKGGRAIMRSCKKSKDPLSGYEMRLRTISHNKYQYNEPGSDMPERFYINEYGDLDTYCYNPDGPYGGEWVGMSSYTCVY